MKTNNLFVIFYSAFFVPSSVEPKAAYVIQEKWLKELHNREIDFLLCWMDKALCKSLLHELPDFLKHLLYKQVLGLKMGLLVFVLFYHFFFDEVKFITEKNINR